VANSKLPKAKPHFSGPRAIKTKYQLPQQLAKTVSSHHSSNELHCPKGLTWTTSQDAREIFVVRVWCLTTAISITRNEQNRVSKGGLNLNLALCDNKTVTNSQTQQEPTFAAPKAMAWLWIIFGLIGWIAAFALVLEKIHVLEHPGDALSCDLNVFISCKSVMASWQSHILGFPNPLIGVAGFAIPIVIGFAVLAGARFEQWFYRLMVAGFGMAFVFVLWLSTQSIFVINVLCPYCMLAWFGTIPLFWHTLLWTLSEDIIEGPVRMAPFFDWAHKRSWIFTAATELVIALIIAVHFWDSWPATFASLFH